MLKKGYKGKILLYIAPLLISVFLSGSFVRGAYGLTTEEEKKLGKTVLLEVRKEGNLVRDLNIQALIERIGYSIVDQVGSTPFEFKFYVINTPEVNAFSVPGGYIFVFTGLIALTENEHELAGVIAHEIAHVTQRHVSQMIEKSQRLSWASLLATLAAMAAGRGGAGSVAGVAMSQGMAGALQLKYTREIETDADQNGLHYLIKAGYDPNGMINFFKKLQKMSVEMAPNIPAYLLDHPLTENRISLLENLLQMGPRPTGPFRTFRNYDRIRVRTFVEEMEPNVPVPHFQSLINADSNRLEGYYGLGLAFRKMGRFDKSMEALQQAHSLAPEDLDVSRDLGIAYFLSGKLDQAIEKLEVVRSVYGEGQDSDLMAIYYLGRGYQEKGDFAKALPLFLKVQKEGLEFIDVYRDLGSVYGRMGQKGLSHLYFGKYFELKGERNNALLHFRTAIDSLERGSPEREEAQREIKELTSPR